MNTMLTLVYRQLCPGPSSPWIPWSLFSCWSHVLLTFPTHSDGDGWFERRRRGRSRRRIEDKEEEGERVRKRKVCCERHCLVLEVSLSRERERDYGSIEWQLLLVIYRIYIYYSMYCLHNVCSKCMLVVNICKMVLLTCQCIATWILEHSYLFGKWYIKIWNITEGTKFILCFILCCQYLIKSWFITKLHICQTWEPTWESSEMIHNVFN